jgi:hypothetical protein
MSAERSQDYCDWCMGPLSPSARTRSERLGLHLEDAWACTDCLESGAYRLPPDGWIGPAEEWPGVTESVVWAASSPTTGAFVANELQTSPEQLAERFEHLRAQGSGYLEVRRDDAYPVLTLGFRYNVAVVHLLTDAESTFLLRGEGTARTASAAVQVMDELMEFTSEFVYSLDDAWEVVQRFALSDGFPDRDRWHEL